MMQLPAPTPDQPLPFKAPEGASLYSWVTPRVIELVYTSHDMAPFASEHGFNGPPFRWNEERRALIRAELDACLFHVYGITRPDVDHILDTFPTIKRKDEATHSTYRTKELIMHYYHRMAENIEDGTEYRSDLDPVPGQGSRH